MKGLFEVAAGSILGRNHARIGKNNQDAYYSFSDEFVTIAVVCDGCGSGKHSEVGAKLGARLIVEVIYKHSQAKIDEDFWERVKAEILIQLETLAKNLAGFSPSLTLFNQLEFSSMPLKKEVGKERVKVIINDYFLFTVVGVLITPLETVIFSLGDGVIAFNGKVTKIESFPNNAPPYLAYSLCGYPEWSKLQIHYQVPTEEVETILIGTDGVSDLIASEDFHLPGKLEKVGNISQFWQENCYFKNPDIIRRRLSLINQEVTKPDWESRQLIKEIGLLPDDTTLIVVRKSI